MYQPQHLPCFKIFFCILCTNRSPSPVDLNSTETSADPHHVAPTPHQSTHAPRHTRKYVPTPPPPCRTTVPQPYHRTVLPVAPPYNRTTAPHSQLYSQPYHRTTAPYSQTHPHTTQATSTSHRAPALQTHHCKYNIPHSQTYHHVVPPHRTHSRTIPTPAGRFDAVPTQHRRSIDAAPTPSRRRTGAAPDATGARVAGPPPTPATALMPRTPDTGTPLAVPVCRARLRYPLVGRVVVRPKAGQRTGSVSQAPAICHTLRTAHRIPRRPAGPTLVGPGRRVPLSPASPAPSPSCASDTGTGQVQVH